MTMTLNPQAVQTQPRTLVVSVKGQDVSFQTPYTNEQARDILDRLPNPSDFARDLVYKSLGSRGLSDRQWAWVHKIAVDATTPKAPIAGVNADLSGVVALMQTAKTHLKWPKITLNVNGVTIQLSVAGPHSKNPGSINITDGGRFGNNQYFGRIDPATGVLAPGRAITNEIRNALTELAKDPAGMAAAHGKRTGNCCFCRRCLTDEREGRSVEVGYGPICAKHYGLPWGEPKTFTAVK
jgi:hypothetical protein